ncbi:pantothenate synthetase [uncultured Paludibacter sp.]|uniref:Pantothenate synthetase n=1 Tax=uncultured Paludibacter sp. TaxID=497635 RepID=A0A653AGQ9_9BACT|nr:pantothenate synthetase [uncultured Paludibacter sp.]
MKIINTISELKSSVWEIKKEKKSIGFVPTMGALHQGHLELVRKCVAENDVCVVSVFVNPTQFNNKTDLEKYPRNIEKDSEMLKSVGCNYVFTPSAEEMYSKNEMENTFEFDFGGMDKVMEGKFRPGHFNGVVQVVSKLFSLIQPDKAYFGLKDFQQLAIIHRMVKVMKFPVEIIDCPIVREPSGLAMSSRNERLSSEQRKNASNIYKILSKSRTFVPEKSPAELIQWVTEQINRTQGLEVEYYDIVDRKTLKTIDKWQNNAVGCIAVFCGEVRLIDNIEYSF